MAKFTEIETEVLKYITDDRLRSSLEKIREAAEDIWADDVPRIIQDYTDHGIKHSERLVDYAYKLLQANDGRILSAQEMYLLLAGIYLHDVGMQCDVVKFPKIKERAEAFGAKFESEFTAKTSSKYSIEEQKDIRKNHQYLAAAWIDHANRTGETVLGHAAKTVPEDIVDDLMDACKYHAKLPITDCPHTFKFDTTGRKQLVTSLLRLSDELDVDGHRVSIETVKNFSLEPRNSVYWWLHNRIKVVFSARNMIILTIRLHPDDLKQHGSLIHTAFITEFQTKNRSVLSVLARNGIPIVIGDDSKVVEHDRAEHLPYEIVKALQIMQQKPNPLLELADEVRTWLQAIRYEVNDPQQCDDRTVDMTAIMELGTVKQRVLVRCIGGEITPEDVDLLDETLDRKTPQGWLISDKRVSGEARKRATEDDAFRVFNLSEFLQQMVWGPYFDALKAVVEKSKIHKLYVDLGCYKQTMDEKGSEISRERRSSLDNYINDWLTERGKMHISILGDFGAGKTWFCYHYAYQQLDCYLKDPVNERLPLLITLRSFAKAMTAQQLINDALLEQYKLPFVGSAFEVFQEMNRRGKLLLILDGFDEMARQVDNQTVVDNFWELANLVDENSKVILTSRAEYFHWAKESEKILGGEEFGRRTILLSPPRFEVLYIEPFNDDQIREVITLRLGTEIGAVTSNRILQTPNLAEMARKPVLVELLLAALDEVSADILENPAKVYLYATNKLLLRNIETKRTFTTTADKLYFLCELAWEMIKSSQLRIHYTEIPDRIETYFGDRIKDKHKLDNWDFDLRNQTLLHRNGAGYYEFAHKSLAEYFVAFKFAAELGCLAPEFTKTYCEAEGEYCKIPIQQKAVITLAETFGAMPLKGERMLTIRNLLQEMMAEDSANLLWKIIDETKEKTEEQVKYCGGNAATLLSSRGESFKGVNLERTVLIGADLFNAELSGANLQGACLHDASLINAILDNSDFCLADLQGVEVKEKHQTAGLTWSSSGLFLAGLRDDTLIIWNVQSYKEEFNLPKISNVHFDRTAQFVPYEDHLLFANGNRLMSAILKNGKWEIEIKREFEQPIGCIALNSEGDILAVLQENKIIIWNRHTQKEYRIMKAEHDTHNLLFVPNSNVLVAAHSGEMRRRMFHKAGVRMWDIELGKVIHEYDNPGRSWSRCNFDADKLGRTLATGAYDNNLIILSLPSFDIIKKIEGTGGYAVTYSPDGTTIAAGCNWFKSDPSKVENRLVLIDVASGEIKLSIDYSDAITSLIFSPDRSYIASAGFVSGEVCIWDVNPVSPTFSQCLKVFEVKMNCHRMQISGAHGLEKVITWRDKGKEREGTLLEFLAERGATLDEKQKQILAEAREQRLGRIK